MIAPSLIPVRAGDRVKTDRRDAKKLVRLYREGSSQWTKMHRAWVARQRLDDDLAHAALCQMLLHLDGLDRQLDQLDRDLELIAHGERWAPTVEILTRFKGVSTRTALGLISEIGDFHRSSHPRELCAWLGIVPSEYSSGQQRHRGHITKTGNHHARRLLIEAAWSYQHRPRRPDRGPQLDARAWKAQIRLHNRYKHLTRAGAVCTTRN